MNKHSSLRLKIFRCCLIIAWILGFLFCGIVYGQERTLVYEYNNTNHSNLGNNSYSFTQELSTSFKIYEKGDTLINESSIGTIKWKINGKSNHILHRIGSGAAFEETYDIDSDSFEVEYFMDNDVIMEMDDDTTKFTKNGEVIYRNMGITVFDSDNKKLNKTKIKLNKNKLKVKFNRPDKTKKVKVDPIFTWQPDNTTGVDAWIESNAPDANHGAESDAYALGIGIWSAGANWQLGRSIIQFIGIGSNIPRDVTITTAYITMTVSAVANGPDTAEAYLLKRDIIESNVDHQVTWNSYATGSAWATPGAFHTDDIYLTNADTTSPLNNIISGKDTIIITNLVTQIAGVDSSIVNEGFLIKAATPYESGSTKRVFWYTAENITSGNRPLLTIIYGIPTVVTGVIQDPKGGTIGGIVTNGKINGKVKYP